eukprot:105895_1
MTEEKGPPVIPLDDLKGIKFNLARLERYLDRNPKLPFQLRRNPESDVTDLVRSTCKRLSESSKYVEINNTKFLNDYANSLNWEQVKGYQTHCHRFGFNLDELPERDLINLSCFAIILAFGSQIYPQSDIIKIGVHNMYKKYPKLDAASLHGITTQDIRAFFEFKLSELVCESLKQYIHEIVRVLLVKSLDDFADYVYNIIDLAWIKSQTKNLSAIETIQWELNDKHHIGLTFAPTESEIVRRCVVVGYTPTDDDPKNMQNNAICARLVDKEAFLYAINDEVVYNLPFDDVITKIRQVLHSTAADPLCPFQRNGVVALQFGLHLCNAPNVVQSSLFNLVNDFSPLSDQYLYKSLFGINKNLRVYLFQRAQAIVLELYYNLFKNASIARKNPIFDFADIARLTAVLDADLPLILLNNHLIQMKKEFRGESKAPIEPHVLVEMKVCALWAIELLVKAGSKHNINAAEIAHYLRGKEY